MHSLVIFIVLLLSCLGCTPAVPAPSSQESATQFVDGGSSNTEDVVNAALNVYDAGPLPEVADAGRGIASPPESTFAG